MVCCTRDHNYARRLEKLAQTGRISGEALAREEARADSLISFIGSGLEVLDRNLSPFCLRPEDVLLLTTDGLYRSVSEERIRSCCALPGAREAAQALTAAAEASGGALDNTTCVVIKCEDDQ
jgi:protein phosphatase